MKSTVSTRIGKWLLGAVIGAGFVYSIAVLTTTPAYAAACTPTQCASFEPIAESVCENAHLGHALGVTCPLPGQPNNFEFNCQLGNVHGQC